MPVNIGTGIDTSIAELARILIDAIGADVEPHFNPRDVLVSRRAADITRAKDVLGFEPTSRSRTGWPTSSERLMERPTGLAAAEPVERARLGRRRPRSR